MNTNTDYVGGKGDLSLPLVDHIVSNVPNVYWIEPVAILSGVSGDYLKQWLLRGKKEYNSNQDTIYAQLWHRYNSVKYNDSKKLVAALKGCPRNYGAITFILERCFKEEFEQKSDMQKQLEDIVFNQLAPLLNKDMSNAKKAEELHQESD